MYLLHRGRKIPTQSWLEAHNCRHEDLTKEMYEHGSHTAGPFDKDIIEHMVVVLLQGTATILETFLD